MQLLFDTHVLLWFLTDDRKLPRKIRSRLLEPGMRLHFSSVSILEIAMKHSLKPDAMPCAPDEVREAAEASGLVELPFASGHSVAVGIAFAAPSRPVRPDAACAGARRRDDAPHPRRRHRRIRRWRSVVLIPETANDDAMIRAASSRSCRAVRVVLVFRSFRAAEREA